MAASGSTSPALIIVGIVVVLGLLAMFVAGRRRAARRTRSTPAHGGRPPGAEIPRGDTWQSPDDDPDQGDPHR
ncbi:DUF6479 family protein [Streptomyces flavofungini]|nr:LPXTG cell wall anchor domain-containing protein [Streptomyces flavofungini]WJV51114.1 DUF6479 family protein [Streptomyces flavofungini]